MESKDEFIVSLEILVRRQNAQLDRMQMQLEEALRKIQQLQALLKKKQPEPEPPSPVSEPPANQPEIRPEESEPPPRPAPKKKKETFGRRPIVKNLERQVETHAPDRCDCGHASFVEIRVETVEVYDYVPAKVIVREIQRVVGRCTHCQTLRLAPFPTDLVPRFRISPSIIALYIYQKMAMHMSWYRVDQELRRMGLSLPESTRDSALIWAEAQLLLLLPLLKEEQFAEGHLNADATGLTVLQEKGGTFLGQMSVYCNQICTIFDFHTTKEGRHQRYYLGLEEKPGCPSPEKPIRFKGYLVADAASNANQNYVEGSGIIECGCNNHARVKFEEAEENERRVASEALGFYKLLYEVEREAKDMTPADRLALRQKKSAPIVERFRLWWENHLNRFSPKEPIRQALNYLRNHWPALTRFLEDGQIPMDNNYAERQLRAIAVGRRNYLFAGSEEAARRLATFYTMVKTCQQHGVDFLLWLIDVLPRISETRSSQLRELLPQHWKKPHPVRKAA